MVKRLSGHGDQLLGRSLLIEYDHAITIGRCSCCESDACGRFRQSGRDQHTILPCADLRRCLGWPIRMERKGCCCSIALESNNDRRILTDAACELRFDSILSCDGEGRLPQVRPDDLGEQAVGYLHPVLIERRWLGDDKRFRDEIPFPQALSVSSTSLVGVECLTVSQHPN